MYQIYMWNVCKGFYSIWNSSQPHFIKSYIIKNHNKSHNIAINIPNCKYCSILVRLCNVSYAFLVPFLCTFHHSTSSLLAQCLSPHSQLFQCQVAFLHLSCSRSWVTPRMLTPLSSHNPQTMIMCVNQTCAGQGWFSNNICGGQTSIS